MPEPTQPNLSGAHEATESIYAWSDEDDEHLASVGQPSTTAHPWGMIAFGAIAITFSGAFAALAIIGAGAPDREPVYNSPPTTVTVTPIPSSSTAAAATPTSPPYCREGHNADPGCLPVPITPTLALQLTPKLDCTNDSHMLWEYCNGKG